MAASKADLRTMVSQWKTRLPGLTEKQYLKLAAIQGGEGGLSSEPEGHRYSAKNTKLEKSFTGSAGVKEKHAEAVKAIKAENKIIQQKNKLITDPKKKLSVKPIPTTREWLRQWNNDLMAKANAGTISRDEHRKQFFDVVYADKGGADYAGIGDFQVTGKQNTIDALKAYGAKGKEFAKILEDDPSAINSLKKNPEFLEAANVGWIKKDLIKTGVINKDMRAVANAVNSKEVEENKANKIATYTGLVKDYQTNLGVKADGDWGDKTEKAWDSKVEREGYKAYPTETADPMKDFLRSIGEKVSSIIPSAQAAETDGVRTAFSPDNRSFAQTDPRRTDLLQQQSIAAQERNFLTPEIASLLAASDRTSFGWNDPRRTDGGEAASARWEFAQTDPRRVDLNQPEPQVAPVQQSMAPPAPAPREPRYGGYVTDGSGNVIVDGSGMPVQYGAGPEEYATMEDLLADRGLMGTRGL